MKRHTCTAAATAMIVFLASAVYAGQTGSKAPTPSFTKDIAPIVFEKCAICHRPGDIAPMSLMTFDDDARPWAKAMRDKVVSREMPPWGADPKYGHFANDRSLTPKEIDTIVSWANGGAPKGSDADLPPAPKFAAGWVGGQPDFVFTMPVDYSVPSDGQLDILRFWVPIPFKEDRFVEAIELRPGNPAVVHHARVDVVELPEGCSVVDGVLMGPDGKPDTGIDANGVRRNVFETSTNEFHLISYVPGRGYERHAPGTAKRLTAGKWVRFEVHYNPNGQATTDRTKLGVWFSKVPVTHEVTTRSAGQPLPTATTADTSYIVEGKQIEPVVGPDGAVRRGRIPNIPPYAENWKIVGMTPVTEPITLYALSPHMHLRGKDMTWTVTWPDGREETLLRIPKYDFNWQINYELATPLHLPAGSRITAVAHYDNSLKNRYVPAPEKEVYWSDQSWDEMFIPYIEYTVDSQTLSSTSATHEP